MRSKTFMSKINLQRGKLTVENRKSREKKRICSEVSVNSPGKPALNALTVQTSTTFVQNFCQALAKMVFRNFYPSCEYSVVFYFRICHSANTFNEILPYVIEILN